MNRGSRQGCPCVARPCHGFNEAPIHESGKYEVHAGEGRSVLEASMRPRFMNRGSQVETIRKGRTDYKLQ